MLHIQLGTGTINGQWAARIKVSLEFNVCTRQDQGKGRYTLDIFACNIAIKRYCDKKTFFSHRYLKAKASF